LARRRWDAPPRPETENMLASKPGSRSLKEEACPPGISSFVSSLDVLQQSFDRGLSVALTPDKGSKHLVIMDSRSSPARATTFTGIPYG